MANEQLPHHNPGEQERVVGRVSDPDDEQMAARIAAPLLISATTPAEVETVAGRIHRDSCGATAPLVRTPAGALPGELWQLRKTWSALLEAAAGGSILMTDVEEMPAKVQGMLLELLSELHSGRAVSAAARLISGTTVSLLDRVSAGAFSEHLFYRLNLIHVVVGRPA